MRGYVKKAIAEGKRPFLTATVSGETFEAIDRMATAQGCSRGRVIDRLVAAAVLATHAPWCGAHTSAFCGCGAAAPPEAETRS